jgi:hypothetical protein
LAELLVLIDFVHRVLQFRSIFLAVQNVRDDCSREGVAFCRFQFTPQLSLVPVDQGLHSLDVDAVLVGNAFQAGFELLREGVQFFRGDRANVDGEIVARRSGVLAKVDVGATRE